MRALTTLAILALTAACAGGEDVDPEDRTADGARPAAETGVAENPGLPTEESAFVASPGGGASNAAIGGRLWVSRSTADGASGISLTAQVEGLPEGAYSWALHRGDCTSPDDLLFGLGFGAIADQRGRGEAVANAGGPLGEMPRTFRPLTDGSAEEVVFVPFDEALSRAALAASPHSVRIHPNVDGERPGASVACAPVPAT